MAEYHERAANYMTRNPNFEPQFKHNWKVYIEGLAHAITLSLESFPVPNTTIAIEEYAHGNQSVYYAGKGTIEGGSMVVQDFVPIDTETQLRTWFNKVYNPETGIRGRAVDYKKTCTIVMLEGDMESTPRMWVTEGTFPTSFETGDLSYTDASKRQITMALSFDNAYPIGR